jgi:polysaccharide biosynthesis transport protein
MELLKGALGMSDRIVSERKALAVSGRETSEKLRGGASRGVTVAGQVRGRSMATPAPSGGGLSGVLHSMRRRWPLGLLLGLLLGPAIGAGAWVLLDPPHTASAMLNVSPDQSRLAFETADATRNGGGASGFKIFKNTQRQIVSSPMVLSAALADPKVRDLPVVREQEDSLQWLREELKTVYPDDAGILRVSLATRDALASKTIVDAVVNAYLSETVLTERNERLARLDNLEKAYAESESKVRSKQAELKQLSDTLGTGDTQSLSLAQQTALQQYGILQSQLSAKSYDLLRAEGELQAIQQSNASAREAAARVAQANAEANATQGTEQPAQPTEGLSQLQLDQYLSRDLVYQRLFSERSRVDEKLDGMDRSAFGDSMKEPFREQLREIDQKMAKRRQEIESLMRKELEFEASKPRVAATSKGVIAPATNEELETQKLVEVEILRKQRAMIEADVQRLDQESRKLGRSSVDLEMMRKEITWQDEVVAKLSTEIEQTRIELKSPPRVTLAGPAAADEGGAGAMKKRIMAAVGGSIGGLLFPLLLLSILDSRRRLIDTPTQLNQELSVEVLGTIPKMSVPMVSRVVNGDLPTANGYGKVADSVSAIVALLMKKAGQDDKRVFMVSSAIPSEGKSTLSQGLWCGLSDAQHRTILVDFDLRRPSLHRQLGVEVGPGISDVLMGKATLEEVTRQLGQNRYCITAGSSRHMNLAGLGADALPQLLNDLRADYDFVLLDTPPILPVVDSRVIGEHVDGAVLSSMRDRSRLPQMVAAIESLRAHDVEILGVVLSGCSAMGYAYAYQAD